MTQYIQKSSDFIEVNTGWQRNVLRINLFNEIVVSSDNSLNPGPEPLAGLRHGVLGEGPHHLRDLRDQIFGFVVWIFSDP